MNKYYAGFYSCYINLLLKHDIVRLIRYSKMYFNYEFQKKFYDSFINKEI